MKHIGRLSSTTILKRRRIVPPVQHIIEFLYFWMVYHFAGQRHDLLSRECILVLSQELLSYL